MIRLFAFVFVHEQWAVSRVLLTPGMYLTPLYFTYVYTWYELFLFVSFFCVITFCFMLFRSYLSFSFFRLVFRFVCLLFVSPFPLAPCLFACLFVFLFFCFFVRCRFWTAFFCFPSFFLFPALPALREAQIHPSSSLWRRNPPAKCVVYTELLSTSRDVSLGVKKVLYKLFWCFF